MDVPRDDVTSRIAGDTAVMGLREMLLGARLATGLKASTIAVAPVKDLALVENNRLALAIRLDVRYERIKLLAFHQREDVSERVEFEYFTHVECAVQERCFEQEGHAGTP